MRRASLTARSRFKTTGAILLVGAGRMGAALLQGWIISRRFPAIHVVEPAPSKALRALAAKKKITLAGEFNASKIKVRAVVIALKPQVLKNETVLLNQVGATGALVVSIAAGIMTGFLRSRLGAKCEIVRTVPNTPGAIGKGITALYASSGTSKAGRALAQALMAPLGETLWFDIESAMDAVTALSGSGPAYVFLLAEAMTQAGIAQGLEPDVAARLARTTIAGAGALLEADKRPAEELRRDVTSPHGTTEAALKILLGEDGLEKIITRAIAAAAARSKELAK